MEMVAVNSEYPGKETLIVTVEVVAFAKLAPVFTFTMLFDAPERYTSAPPGDTTSYSVRASDVKDLVEPSSKPIETEIVVEEGILNGANVAPFPVSASFDDDLERKTLDGCGILS